ncbi:MAG: hypothetical protein K0S49_22 [Microbacterium sp.]|jgi:hypothetical protein|nr:hypothetical protein [Microbacterium sp.]
MSTTDDTNTDPQAPADDAPESEWKAYARLWEKRAKEKPKVSDEEIASLRDKAEKFDAAEQANLSELEQWKNRAEAAEQWKAERESKDSAAKLAADIAKEKGVPVGALRGTTREELEAHADELLTFLPKPPAAPSADGQGEGDPIGNGDMSADDIVEAAVGR